MNPFLKAKHWQIFVLLFGLPILIQAFWMANLFFTFQDPSTNKDVFFDVMIGMLPLMLGIVLLLAAFQAGWYFSVAFGLRKYTPQVARLRILPFVVSFVIPILYFIVIGQFLYQLYKTNYALPRWFDGGAAGLLFFMHFMAMACMLYALYYTAKAYKTALLRRRVKRGEVLSEFFMIWFLFIGIWFIQPQINEIIKGELDPKEEEAENTDFSSYTN